MKKRKLTVRRQTLRRLVPVALPAVVAAAGEVKDDQPTLGAGRYTYNNRCVRTVMDCTAAECL